MIFTDHDGNRKKIPAAAPAFFADAEDLVN